MPLSHTGDTMVVGSRDSSGPSPGTGVCHCSVAILKLQACAKLCTLGLYLFGVVYNSRIYADPHFRAVGAIIPF